ncbi:MAG: UDP-N-acetylmuramate dehydrogenase [bacterium]
MKILENVDLAARTTFKIGGPAHRFYELQNRAELTELRRNLGEDWGKTICLGGGSNILFPDEPLDNIVFKLTGEFEKIECQDQYLQAGAAVPLPLLAERAARAGLSGLEWAAGIPGSLGGALIMNAGSFGSDISELVVEVEILNSAGRLIKRSPQELQFDYRSSSFSPGEVIVAAKLKLKKESREKVEKLQREYLARKRATQPLEYPCAGCVFKNLKDVSAGELIERAGLKGERIGEVEVSEKHANFFINRGGARCADVLRLIQRVRRRVFNMFEKKLSLELTVINFSQL